KLEALHSAVRALSVSAYNRGCMWHVSAPHRSCIGHRTGYSLHENARRQVGNLCPLQNPPGIDASLTVGVGKTGSVTHQAASRHECAKFEDRGNRVAERQRGELVAPADEEGIGPTAGDGGW